MHHFHYRQGVLHAEEVSLEEIARQVGTPTYVYSQATLTRHYLVFDEAFAGVEHLVCYSVKVNSNRSVIALFNSLGSGADIVSGGELARALAAGVKPERIVYSGVGKTTAEMEMALEAGILMFNLESEQELVVLNQVAGALGRKAPISFRVNPDVDPKTHPKITTGLAKNKFGLAMEIALAQYQAAARLPHVEVRGVSFHIGSQITQVEPFADALARVALLVERLRDQGMDLQYVDIGGGLGIPYRDEEPPPPAEYARAVVDVARSLGLTLILEPGRVLTGNAGVLLTRVLYTKRTPAKCFVVVDAAMNDLVRPTLYGAYHHIQPVEERPAAQTKTVDVVGPICESGDFLARDRRMPEVKRGDLLAVMSAGAYGFSMSSNYNSRPRAAEVMVNGERFAVVRQRESLEDLSRGEVLPPWLA